MENPTHFGFKKITLENWDRIGLPPGFQHITPSYWIGKVMKGQLDETVPKEIRALYEVARGTCVYGLLFYPLMTIGAQQCFRVLEAAIVAKRKSLKLPPLKRPSVKLEINRLIQRGAIARSEKWRWQLARNLRNVFSHPSFQEIMVPGEVLRYFEQPKVPLIACSNNFRTRTDYWSQCTAPPRNPVFPVPSSRWHTWETSPNARQHCLWNTWELVEHLGKPHKSPVNIGVGTLGSIFRVLRRGSPGDRSPFQVISVHPWLKFPVAVPSCPPPFLAS